MPSTKRPDRRMPALPVFVQIEPVGQCNLRCEMCSLRFRAGGRSGRAFMTVRVFRKLVDELAGAASILHLQGLGEPLLHPAFFRMVSYAAGRGFRVSTNSNLTLLGRKRAEECVHSGLSWIRISIDGASQQVYESIRIGARLRSVLRNVELLCETKERKGSARPRLFLVMVAMRRNLHELGDVVRLAHRFSMEQVFVQHLCHDFAEEALPGRYRAMREFVESETLMQDDRERIERHFREATVVARELNIELRLPSIDCRGRQDHASGRERCDWPWRSAYISYDGRSVPCCMIATPDRMNFGNMARDGIGRVWNSEAYHRFRSRLDSAEPPAVCRSCSLYRGIF